MNSSVVSHDPTWARQFAREAGHIQAVFGPNAVAIHPIGSTAIPGILAKPIIDILVEVLRLDRIDQGTGRMADLGYEAMGAYGIDGRRYFRKINSTGLRTHHVHVFEKGSTHIVRHVAFRDFLRADPDKAKEYSKLKTALVGEGGASWDEYLKGKEPFIRTAEKAALEWYLARR